jgi:hypothetical protein
MSDRSKSRGQTKCRPCASKLGIGRGANIPIAEKSSVTKPPISGGDQDLCRFVAPERKRTYTLLAVSATTNFHIVKESKHIPGEVLVLQLVVNRSLNFTHIQS